MGARQRPCNRHTGLQRTIEILFFILDAPKTLPEIAAHLGVHERTVRRYLEALSLAGLPIVQHDVDDRRPRWGCLRSRPIERILGSVRGAA
jgi:predicted ArsR family transcriptional regulator